MISDKFKEQSSEPITDKIFGFLKLYRGNNTKCQSLYNNIG